jgi:hypothetical protein
MPYSWVKKVFHGFVGQFDTEAVTTYQFYTEDWVQTGRHTT